MFKRLFRGENFYKAVGKAVEVVGIGNVQVKRC
jgi:hypothetical protein